MKHNSPYVNRSATFLQQCANQNFHLQSGGHKISAEVGVYKVCQMVKAVTTCTFIDVLTDDIKQLVLLSQACLAGHASTKGHSQQTRLTHTCKTNIYAGPSRIQQRSIFAASFLKQMIPDELIFACLHFGLSDRAPDQVHNLACSGNHKFLQVWLSSPELVLLKSLTRSQDASPRTTLFF